MKIKLLFVDDDPSSARSVINSLEGNYDSCIVGFSEAEEKIEEWMPNVVVLDLRNGNTETFAGFEIYRWIWERWFCPIVIYSAYSQEFVEFEPHPFVKNVQKGATSVALIKSALAEFSPHMKALHDAERQMRQQFAIALREVGRYAFGDSAAEEPEQRSDMILRAGRRRLAALSDRDPRDGKTLASWEQYLFPPVDDDLNLGDILKEKGQEGPGSFYVVLTPSCDLAASGGRTPKVKLVLAAHCCAFREALGLVGLSNISKDSLKRLILTQGHYGIMIPLPAFAEIPHMAANLRDLVLIPLEKIGGEKYERVASIDSPFREVVAWAYMQVGCRPGLPDRDFDAWSNEIIEILRGN
jgi:hypothetical protein